MSKTVTPEQWKMLDNYRDSVEEEFYRNIILKPKNMKDYQKVTSLMKKGLEKCGLDLTDQSTVFTIVSLNVANCNLFLDYFGTTQYAPICIPLMREPVLWIGFLCRELLFDCGAPLPSCMKDVWKDHLKDISQLPVAKRPKGGKKNAS